MSYDSRAVLKGPDEELRALQYQQQTGGKLAPSEARRLAQKLAARESVELETLRTGGRVTRPIGREQPAATPFQAGQKFEQGRQGFNAGRDSVINSMGDFSYQAIAQDMWDRGKSMRRSPVANDSPLEDKIADNELGPHLGADGLPARWNTPKQIGGRFNGGNLNEGANLPPGTTAMMGADGLWKTWQGGRFTDQRFASLEDVGRGNAIRDQRAGERVRAALPGAPVPIRTLEDDREYIRKSGYGDVLDRLDAAAQESPRSGPASSDRKPDMAPAYSIKGVLQRAGTPEEWAMAPANIVAFPGRVVDGTARGLAAVARGMWNGNYSMPPSLTETVGKRVGDFLATPSTNQPNTRAQPQDFSAMSELGAFSGQPQPNPLQPAPRPAPVVQSPLRPAPRSPSLTPATGPEALVTPAPPIMMGEDEEKALGNQGRTKISWSGDESLRNTQYHTFADTFNPFAVKRRKTSVLPE